MRQPPRSLAEPLIGRAQFLLGLAQGAGLLVACLAVYGLALQQVRTTPEARFLAFAALTAGNLLLALVNATRQPLIHGLRVARLFIWITLGAAGALAACLATPWTRALFGFEWAGGTALAAALAARVLSTALCVLAKGLPSIARILGVREARP